MSRRQSTNPLQDIRDSAASLRQWLAAHTPPTEHADFCEWCSAFSGWELVYAAFQRLGEVTNPSSWDDASMNDALFLLALDNESEFIAGVLAAHPEILILIASHAATAGVPDAQWQLADHLAAVSTDTDRAHEILLRFADSPNEYARRRALGALASMQSPETARRALAQWNLAQPAHEYTRRMCLWALHRVGSPEFSRLVQMLRPVEDAPLVKYANELKSESLGRP